MAIRIWLASVGIALVCSLTGCQAWCQRNYPCPPVSYGYSAQPVACLPCCPPGSGYAAAPAPVPTRTWSNPVGGQPCVPCN
ncbi:MAG: hypothetical protein SNJ82_03290 [Gemmataceae bacterium]